MRVGLLADTIGSTFGFEVPVVIRTSAALQAALDAHPFAPPVGGDKLPHILFCDTEPPAAKVAALDWFERQLGVGATGRNLMTVRALLDRTA